MVTSDAKSAAAREPFSLRRLAFVLSRYAPPEGGFDPPGQWATEYTYYSLGYWHFRRQGCLRVERRPRHSNTVFSFKCKRLGRSKYNHYTSAEVVTGNDPLCVPLTWEMEAKLAASPDEAPYLFSGLKKKARFHRGTLTVTCKGDSETTHIPGAYTCKWCLIDVVQRLPGALTRPQSFSLVDEFDAVRHDQTIAFRTSAAVSLMGEPHTLTAYVHLGEGVIPTVYWVDEFGRALFIVSGVEAFVLTQANGVAARFDDGRLHGQPMAKLFAEKA